MQGHEPGRDQDGDWYTTHGFRSCFRTWAEERTNSKWEVRELSLAHMVGSKIERSYSRTKLIDLQRKLKNQWAQFCVPPAGETVRVFPANARRA